MERSTSVSQIEIGQPSDRTLSPVESSSHQALTITRIAHSCTLLDFGGYTFLADPWFSQKFGYHQGEPIALSPKELPRLTGVLISHAHYDHDDVEALVGALEPDIPMLVEAGAVKSARKAGFTNVIPLAPWQSTPLGPVTITATPAQHAVAEIGFVVQAFGFTVYFGGDSLLTPQLDEIPRRFPDIDVAIVPINGLKVFGKQVAMNPIEAAELCGKMRPTVAVPTHYAFSGGVTDLFMLEYYAERDELPKMFCDAIERYAPATRPVILDPGKSVSLQAAERKAAARS
jgi:L-ascorbate metabolism protein UlaG (beta-lactamase superfamily)